MNKKSILYVGIKICAIITVLITIMYFTEYLYNKVEDSPIEINNHSINKQPIYDSNGNYIKIQNRMSMDWSANDKDWLLLIMDLNGGTIEDKATAMIIALDHISSYNESIPQYTVNMFGSNTRLQYEDIESDLKAYNLVINEGWDETGAIEREGMKNGK